MRLGLDAEHQHASPTSTRAAHSMALSGWLRRWYMRASILSTSGLSGVLRRICSNALHACARPRALAA